VKHLKIANEKRLLSKNSAYSLATSHIHLRTVLKAKFNNTTNNLKPLGS